MYQNLEGPAVSEVTRMPRNVRGGDVLGSSRLRISCHQKDVDEKKRHRQRFEFLFDGALSGNVCIVWR